jgi:hypothetical protein
MGNYKNHKYPEYRAAIREVKRERKLREINSNQTEKDGQ